MRNEGRSGRLAFHQYRPALAPKQDALPSQLGLSICDHSWGVQTGHRHVETVLAAVSWSKTKLGGKCEMFHSLSSCVDAKAIPFLADLGNGIKA